MIFGHYCIKKLYLLTLYASIIRLITLLEFAESVPTADFGIRFLSSCGKNTEKNIHES